jgi:hypothetical protein
MSDLMVGQEVRVRGSEERYLVLSIGVNAAAVDLISRQAGGKVRLAVPMDSIYLKEAGLGEAEQTA